MNVLVLLIAASLLIATGFLLGFIWAVRSGQYEDTDTPAMRMLWEDAGRIGPARLDPAAIPPHPGPLPRGEGAAYSARPGLDPQLKTVTAPDSGSAP